MKAKIEHLFEEFRQRVGEGDRTKSWGGLDGFKKLSMIPCRRVRGSGCPGKVSRRLRASTIQVKASSGKRHNNSTGMPSGPGARSLRRRPRADFSSGREMGPSKGPERVAATRRRS
eukprot:Lithocolla_globosa_v1_NODE_253_length_4814_cov_57.763606.p6 type:complete len:116 gc:universal NODE_253_length_4814_cov_57.763606:2122-2469(+)